MDERYELKMSEHRRNVMTMYKYINIKKTIYL